MIRDDVTQFIEPEKREFRQHAALARNGRRQDDVEGRQAIRLHDEQPVFTHGIEIAHLAAMEELEALEITFEKRGIVWHDGNREIERRRNRDKASAAPCSLIGP